MNMYYGLLCLENLSTFCLAAKYISVKTKPRTNADEIWIIPAPM